MELQQVRIEKPIPYPPAMMKETAEIVLSESQKKTEPGVIAEREEFVRRIEAYCDCV
jgi:hypothetical protein